MRRSTRLLAPLVLLGLITTGQAQTTRPVTQSEVDAVRAAIRAAKPGDTIALPRGEFRDVELKFDAKGSEDKPITLSAFEPGKSFFTGTSSLRIAGQHLVVDGIIFTGPTTAKTAPISFTAESVRCRLTNSAVIDFDPADFETRFHYVRIDGTGHRVDHCELAGKTNLGPMLAADGGTDVRIDRNLFRDFPHNPKNGREVIQIIGVGSNDEPLESGGANWVVEENLFLRAHGEGAEIISVKSNHNVIRHNTIRATKGALTMRSGGGNTFDGNVIFGDGMVGAGGLRVSGRNGKAIDNYIAGVSGTAIQLHTGEYIESDISGVFERLTRKGSPLGHVAHYLQLKDGVVSNNIVVGTTGTEFVYGSGYGANWPKQQMILLPDNLAFENNVFVAPDDASRPMARVNRGDERVEKLPPQVRPRPTQGRNNFLSGGTRPPRVPAELGFRTENPKLAVANNGLQLPTPDGPAVAGGFDRTPFEALRPLTESHVGPTWRRTATAKR
jgi:poly(beta-D-mannuronate) lyase